MRRAHLIAAYLLITLGLVHIGFANDGNFTERSLWFVGAGLAAIFGGFLNLAFQRAGAADSGVRLLCHIANVLLTVFFIVGAYLVPRPQAFAALALVLLLATAAFFQPKN